MKKMPIWYMFLRNFIKTKRIVRESFFNKAFDSAIHLILVNTLEKHSISKGFINWIKILLKNRISFVINYGVATGL